MGLGRAFLILDPEALLEFAAVSWDCAAREVNLSALSGIYILLQESQISEVCSGWLRSGVVESADQAKRKADSRAGSRKREFRKRRDRFVSPRVIAVFCGTTEAPIIVATGELLSQRARGGWQRGALLLKFSQRFSQIF